jgi:hypothetical protein
MKVQWVGIYDRGNLLTERVHFRAIFDFDLCFYAVLDTHYQGVNVIEAHNKNCYWFGSYQVKAGQNIVLYTRAGAQNTETRNDGSVFHFFFRGLNQPLYQSANRCAVIFEINSWITTLQGS